jgi:hypothetical protein
MCDTVSVGRTSVAFRSMILSLLQSSHPGLARAPIMCSHFPHGNEHVITCLARLVLASCTALELIHEPSNYRLSPSLGIRSLPPATLEFWFDSQTRGTKENRVPPCVQAPGSSRVPATPWVAPYPLMVGIRSPDGLVVGLAPATLEFWARFPNERNQGKQGATLC